jgi:fused signal recognition particle receptor
MNFADRQEYYKIGQIILFSNMFSKFKNFLSKTRASLSQGWAKLAGKTIIDEATLEELETLLLKADVGLQTTEYLLNALQQRPKEDKDVLSLLKEELLKLLKPCEKTLTLDPKAQPFTILVVGVNGAGKTTSIAKLAQYFQQQQKKVLFACGDTFRAAATEQLVTWAERLNIPYMAQNQGADSASVIFDALQSAQAKHIDLLLADTAGRLHTQNNLMDELKKIVRVIKKVDATAPQEVLLVLDASTGQNALRQLKEFHQAVNVTGLILTKLDGTAKGGVVLALAQEFALPIYFVGYGEGINDLAPFSAQAFVEGLFN